MLEEREIGRVVYSLKLQRERESTGIWKTCAVQCRALQLGTRNIQRLIQKSSSICSNHRDDSRPLPKQQLLKKISNANAMQFGSDKYCLNIVYFIQEFLKGNSIQIKFDFIDCLSKCSEI